MYWVSWRIEQQVDSEQRALPRSSSAAGQRLRRRPRRTARSSAAVSALAVGLAERDQADAGRDQVGGEGRAGRPASAAPSGTPCAARRRRPRPAWRGSTPGLPAERRRAHRARRRPGLAQHGQQAPGPAPRSPARARWCRAGPRRAPAISASVQPSQTRRGWPVARAAGPASMPARAVAQRRSRA